MRHSLVELRARHRAGEELTREEVSALLDEAIALNHARQIAVLDLALARVKVRALERKCAKNKQEAR